MPTFKSARFGELTYRERDVVRLQGGLIGLPQLKRWLILDMGDRVPAKWLQSLDRSDFGFPVLQPYYYTDDYQTALSETVLRLIDCDSEENLVTLIITTVHEGGAKITGNLLAPLIIDTGSRCGIQLTVDDDRYAIRQEVDYFKFGLAVCPESSENEASGEGERRQAERAVEVTEAVKL